MYVVYWEKDHWDVKSKYTELLSTNGGKYIFTSENKTYYINPNQFIYISKNKPNF